VTSSVPANSNGGCAVFAPVPLAGIDQWLGRYRVLREQRLAIGGHLKLLPHCRPDGSCGQWHHSPGRRWRADRNYAARSRAAGRQNRELPGAVQQHPARGDPGCSRDRDGDRDLEQHQAGRVVEQAFRLYG
jgi:hypothetical protein